MKKITVTVDGTGAVSLDGSDAGYYGEHLATCLEITPAVTFSENCEYYKMNIDGYVSERLTPTDGKITYTLPGSALRPPSISCQLIGYKLVDSVPVMVIRSALFSLNVAVSPLGEPPEIIKGSLQPLETALAECGNTVAAAEKLLDEITDAQGATRTELKNLKDSAAASAAAAAESETAAAVSVERTAGYYVRAEAKADEAEASAENAAESAAAAAASAETVNPNNFYKKTETYAKDETYSKTDADKRFAARSSENSIDPSSVKFAQALLVKQDDSGGAGSAFLWDEFPDESPTILWSSEKTMETVRAEQGNLSANAVKKTVSGRSVQINDASPVTHEPEITVSKNIFPKIFNILSDEFSFADGVVTGTVESDGKIVVNINSRTTETLNFSVCTVNLDTGVKYTYSGNPSGCSYGSYYSQITRTTGAENHALTTYGEQEFTVNYGGEFKFTIFIQANKDPQQIVFTPKLSVTDGADEVEVIEYDGGGNVAARVTPEADGTVKGIKSYPTMKITTNNSAYAVNVTYNRDLNRVVEELQQAIISLKGNL